ncbi:hypothetical protein CF386_06510 [Paraphotobacterium marinum]|uniref:Uncharacterized protein n=1 Tax=Paraphotobacterium marinum TaxID=1755811 RepID=A0A220VEN1_9GAMM|nr:AGE family epimerase/isomerase [Paraphotobacterium marinum]ASK78676.1 hypothetical protein CF386_06510 [Paraphotobacterium marinum]
MNNDNYKKYLDSYCNLIKESFNMFNFIPEILDDEFNVDFEDTRLLCQTRNIYFLIKYYELFKDEESKFLALRLYKQTKKNYFDPVQGYWKKRPSSGKLNDLYEFSFLIFSFSILYKHFLLDEIKNDILFLFDEVRQDFISKGFESIKDDSGVICQNAIMHLYEALLEYYRVTNSTSTKIEIKLLFSVIKQKFINPETNLIAEYSKNHHETVYEPGHNYEWASLLLESEKLGLKIETKDFCEHLVHSMENMGLSTLGFVYPKLNVSEKNAEFRIWPNLERLRYFLLTNNDSKSDTATKIICQFYFNKCYPIEYIDSRGKALTKKIKATTGYHLISAFKEAF